MLTCSAPSWNSSKPSFESTLLVNPLHTIARDNAEGAIVTVHVQPKASRTECVGMYGDALKIRVAARPIGGAANEELIRFLAERCEIPRASVRIRAGAEARRKRLSVMGVTAESLLARLLPHNEKGTVG
jgi:uncharacterized protein